MLADFGAEVIKIELPEGDLMRRRGPFPGDEAHPERSGTEFPTSPEHLRVMGDMSTRLERHL